MAPIRSRFSSGSISLKLSISDLLPWNLWASPGKMRKREKGGQLSAMMANEAKLLDSKWTGLSLFPPIKGRASERALMERYKCNSNTKIKPNPFYLRVRNEEGKRASSPKAFTDFFAESVLIYQDLHRVWRKREASSGF